MHLPAVRRASALFVTMITVGLVGFLLLRAVSTVGSRVDTQRLTEAKQQAAYAAESVASLMEVELVRIAATNDLEALANNGTRDIDTDGDGLNDTRVWDGQRWFANCLVRWRIEPVIVTNGTRGGPAESEDEFAVNPAHDPGVTTPSAYDIDGDGDNEDLANN